VTGSPRRTPPSCVHTTLEVCPTVAGDPDLVLWNLTSVLAKDVQKDHQVPGASIEDAIELAAEVTAKLTQLAVDLRAMRKGKVRHRRRERVEPVDLVVQDDLALGAQALDELVNRLRAVASAVVDRLKMRHEMKVSPASRHKCAGCAT
jgi:hypothetical protein